MNKKYSIIIIPESSAKIKSFEVKSSVLKLMGCAAAILITVAIVIALVSGKPNDDTLLKKDIQVLSQTVTEQNKLIKLNEDKMSLIEKNDAANKKMLTDYAQLYSDLTNKIVSKTNRGSQNDSSINYINELIKLSGSIEKINEAFTNDKQLTEQISRSKESLEKYAECLPTLVPVSGKITSPFGIRKHPITKVVKEHTGVDIDADKGDPILAAASGEVSYSSYMNGYGYTIIIDHHNGFQTLYGHCSKLLVKKAEKIKKGQVISLVGSTGLSTGPHLHFEIRVNDKSVDPMKYIDFKLK
jgi:murein DD-endopeptidase MepM/ murein hydrolase activator NlpD